MQRLELKEISVDIDENRVLRKVNLEIERGTVHALLGEHGSGKSTLCKIIAGVLQPNSGKIIIDGKELPGISIKRAQMFGIRMISQENLFVENLSVAANLFLNNRSAFNSLLVSHRTLCRKAQIFFQSWNVDLNPAEKMGNLHEGDRFIINLLKNVYTAPSLLVLDESFDKLSMAFLDKTKAILSGLSQTGVALLIVTHKVDELFEFAHQVTVLKSGSVLFRNKVEETDSIDLIRLAYTQLSEDGIIENEGKEFYSLLKYNRAILERLPINLVVVDELLQLKIVNNSAKEFLSLEKEGLYNRKWSTLEFASVSGLTPILESLVLVPEFKTLANIPVILEEHDHVVDLTIFPIYDGKHFLGLIIIINDVTEKERMREKMMLAEKLTSVGLLSAGVAHEINNPLEIICNYIDHLRVRSGGNPETEMALTQIEQEIESISQITKNLILFGEDSLDRTEEIEIDNFIAETLKLVGRSARNKDIRVEFNVGLNLDIIKGNRNELKQVVLNIVRNAFEAMPKGGILAVSSASIIDETRRIHRIRFRDNGPGLGTQNGNDLFLPFFSTKDGEAENLGLGLSICYSIVQKHDGTISCADHPDGGAVFSLSFPVIDGIA